MSSSISRSGFARFVAAAGTFFAASSPAGAATPKLHRTGFHIDQNDPAIMNLLLGNFTNLMEYYAGIGEAAQVEIVAYGPGLNMLRADTSPVKDRLTALKLRFPMVVYSACHNTMMAMEKAEGHPIEIVPEARVVPAGVVRLSELQEQGFTYIKP
jgi:intracellular sulfur oxidation DsrE/DsrF family protein